MVSRRRWSRSFPWDKVGTRGRYVLCMAVPRRPMSQICNSKEQEFGRDNVAVEGPRWK